MQWNLIAGMFARGGKFEAEKTVNFQEGHPTAPASQAMSMEMKNKASRSDKIARVTISMPQSTKDAIDALAEDLGLTFSGTVKQIFAREMALQALVEEGADLFVRFPDGREYLLGTTLLSNGGPTFSLPGPKADEDG